MSIVMTLSMMGMHVAIQLDVHYFSANGKKQYLAILEGTSPDKISKSWTLMLIFQNIIVKLKTELIHLQTLNLAGLLSPSYVQISAGWLSKAFGNGWCPYQPLHSNLKCLALCGVL